MQTNQFFKNVLRLFFIILLCAAIASSFFVYKLNKFSKTPHGSDVKAKKFVVKSGQTLSEVSQHLENKGIIKDSRMFNVLARLNSATRNIKAGEYTVSGPKSPRQILKILREGKVNLHRLTIPEGLNISEIAAIVDRAGFGPEDDFIRLGRDAEFARSLGVNADSLEGYLFPETYFFEKDTSQKRIIKKLVESFHTVFTPQWEKRAEEIGMTVHETVILASIIEKETGDERERPVISSVFHNRLKKGMRLESDPTVIYGIENFDGNITKKDLKQKTPYNTYTLEGLPKGPIANPGAMALKAALYPEKTDYLFFVSKKDTTHKFSKTVKEHNRAVRKYQLNH